MMLFRLIPAAVAAALAAGPSLADNHQVRVWAASCAACHGTNGAQAGAIPSIAGKDKVTLYQQLLDFKSGAKPATVMHQHTKGYTGSELERLAAHFSQQKATGAAR